MVKLSYIKCIKHVCNVVKPAIIAYISNYKPLYFILTIDGNEVV